MARVVLLTATYYVTAELSLRLALVRGQVTPIWPPTGIAVVGFLLFGRRVWPGVVLAAFLVNAPIGPSPLAAAVIATGNTAAPLLAVTLLQRTGFRTAVDRLRDAATLVFLGAIVNMIVSATVGATTLELFGGIPSSSYWSTWWVWWAGDAMGVLIVAPFLLSLLRPFARTLGSTRRRLEASGFLILTVGVTAAVFRSP